MGARASGSICEGDPLHGLQWCLEATRGHLNTTVSAAGFPLHPRLSTYGACKLEANQLSCRQYKPKGIARVKRPFSAFSLCWTKGAMGWSKGHSSSAQVKLVG